MLDMKHIIYTCARCDKQASGNGFSGAPTEWATIVYERDYMKTPNSMATTRVETHACPDCAKDVLVYLEPQSQTAPRLEAV